MTTRDWVEDRKPPVPLSFRDALATSEPPTSDGLARAARASLVEALAARPEDRNTAFTLLAADAFATYAASLALEEERGEAGIHAVLATLLGPLD